MTSKALINEWVRFAKMDLDTAIYLFNNMYPKPLEIICYHCQQSAEKMLKCALIYYGENINKTHDLGLLAEACQRYFEVSEEYLDMCDELTPYSVRIRYPQELYIEERHARSAVDYANKIFSWIKSILDIDNIC